MANRLPKSRPFYHTVSVDVDIDDSVLAENGYHHEEDCGNTAEETEDELRETERQVNQLHDWHLERHGLVLWSGCAIEPCNVLSHDFRRTS